MGSFSLIQDSASLASAKYCWACKESSRSCLLCDALAFSVSQRPCSSASLAFTSSPAKCPESTHEWMNFEHWLMLQSSYRRKQTRRRISMNTFFHHGLSFLGDSLNARLMTGDLGLQGLVLLQQVLDTNQVFAWEKTPRETSFRTSISHLNYLMVVCFNSNWSSFQLHYLCKLSIWKTICLQPRVTLYSTV